MSIETKVFADGTPGDPGREDFPFDRVEASAWRGLMSQKRRGQRLAPNPTAADVHIREAGAPWRVSGEREVQESNDAARPELFRKRMRALALQTSQGLRTAFGIEFDATSLQSKLTDGAMIRERQRRAHAEAAIQREAVLAQRAEIVAAAESVLEAARLAEERVHEAAAEVARLEKLVAEQAAAEAAAAATTGKSKSKSKSKGKSAAAVDDAVTEDMTREASLKLTAASAEAEAAAEAAAPVNDQLQHLDVQAANLSRRDASVTEAQSSALALLDAATSFRLELVRLALGLDDPRDHDSSLV